MNSLKVETHKEIICSSIKSQGDRDEQMDEISHTRRLLDMNETNQKELHVIGVFDGHSKPHVSRFLGEHLTDELADWIKSLPNIDTFNLKYDWFPQWNHRLLKNLPLINGGDEDALMTNARKGGSTACVVFIHRQHIYCANVGDSKAVLCRNGVVISLSQQHRYINKMENRRVLSEGGFFQNKGQLGDSGLNVCRSIGDFHCYDKSGLMQNSFNAKSTCLGFSSEPEIMSVKESELDEFIFIASDGVWDRCDETKLIHYVRLQLMSNMTIEEMTEITMEYILKCQPCSKQDNISFAIVILTRDQSLRQFQDTMMQRLLAGEKKKILDTI